MNWVFVQSGFLWANKKNKNKKHLNPILMIVCLKFMNIYTNLEESDENVLPFVSVPVL